jgi:hypothetical protein
MKNFNEYLELVNETKGVVRMSSRRGAVKQRVSSFSGSEGSSQVSKKTNKIMSTLNQKVNNAYVKFRGSITLYSDSIISDQFLNFKFFNDYYDEHLSEKRDKDIKNIVIQHKNIFSIYKEIFNRDADEFNPSITYEILSIFNQNIKIESKGSIKDKNIAAMIYNKIVDSDIKKVLSEMIPGLE